MSLTRLIKYYRIKGKRKKAFAALAVSLALANLSMSSVKFRSVGNGMADISLKLTDDSRFQLNLTPFNENKKYVLKGKWTADEDNYVLQFGRMKKDIESLFDSNTGFVYKSIISDKNTVLIPRSDNGVMIYGIYCPLSTI